MWQARYTARNGKKRSAGTFPTKYLAQDAIDAAYEREAERERRPEFGTVGAYAPTWTKRRPRSDRTNATNDHRTSRGLAVEIEGFGLRAWRMDELRRRHALDFLAHLLGEGRSARGAMPSLEP